MKPLDIMTRVERHGGVLAINDDGRLVLLRARGVPANLVGDIRRHKAAIIAAIAARSDALQLPLVVDEPPAAGFWAVQEARFEAMMAEYGVDPAVSR